MDKVILHSDEMEAFSYPSSVPFNTSRAGKVKRTLCGMGLYTGEGMLEVSPVAATREELEMFHTAEYLDALKQAGEGYFDEGMFQFGLGMGDCPVFEGMWDYGLLAVGGTITGAKKILSSEACVAFNPSGGFHHAHPGRASGFCYINDVVLGLMTLANAGKRVLFLDVDVHHSDGVQEAFYCQNDVMTISLHQDGRTLFPGTGYPADIGEGDGKGYSVNVPLPGGTYDGAYMKVIAEVVLPLIGAYAPDVIAVEIGADALAGDPLAQLCLTNNVYADIIGKLIEFGKPILATGGGGYHVENTVRAWSLCWAAMCGNDNPHEHLGMGGVMMESTEWQGGLRDREQVVDTGQRMMVDPVIAKVVEKVKSNVFGYHGL